jgi:hypothetical protein
LLHRDDGRTLGAHIVNSSDDTANAVVDNLRTAPAQGVASVTSFIARYKSSKTIYNMRNRSKADVIGGECIQCPEGTDFVVGARPQNWLDI